MPAIQPARLKSQVDGLMSHFHAPDAFIRELHLILDFYADRTRRPGLTGKPKPLIRSYNVPRQVLRSIETGLLALIEANPDDALALADALWADAWFEGRRLAIDILGALPLSQADAVMERVQGWGKPCKDEDLTEMLLARGTARLRTEAPDAFLQQIERWFTAPDAATRRLGLRAIPGLAANPKFENLPILYRLLTSLLRDAESSLEGGLLRAVQALAQRSPQETAYFLQQILQTPHQPGVEIIVRRSLGRFPAPLDETLRATLRSQRHRQR